MINRVSTSNSEVPSVTEREVRGSRAQARVGRQTQGRTIDPALSSHILVTTLSLLETRGFVKLTVRDIAAQSGVSVASIYRRWPTKTELIHDALGQVDEWPGSEVGPSEPLKRLKWALWSVSKELQGPKGALLAGILSQVREDPALADIFRSIKRRYRADFSAFIQACCKDPVANLQMRADLGISLIVFRWHWHGETTSKTVIERQIVPLMLEGLKLDSV